MKNAEARRRRTAKIGKAGIVNRNGYKGRSQKGCFGQCKKGVFDK